MIQPTRTVHLLRSLHHHLTPASDQASAPILQTGKLRTSVATRGCAGLPGNTAHAQAWTPGRLTPERRLLRGSTRGRKGQVAAGRRRAAAGAASASPGRQVPSASNFLTSAGEVLVPRAEHAQTRRAAPPGTAGDRPPPRSRRLRGSAPARSPSPAARAAALTSRAAAPLPRKWFPVNPDPGSDVPEPPARWPPPALPGWLFVALSGFCPRRVIELNGEAWGSEILTFSRLQAPVSLRPFPQTLIDVSRSLHSLSGEYNAEGDKQAQSYNSDRGKLFELVQNILRVPALSLCRSWAYRAEPDSWGLCPHGAYHLAGGVRLK